MLRSGRFRHRLLDDVFLKEQSPYCINCLQSFLRLWNEGRIDDVEMAAIYILIFAFFRRPKDFLGGAHNKPLDYSENWIKKSISSSEVIQVLRATLPPHLQAVKSLSRLENSKSFVEVFCSMSWRSIPLSAAISLCAWKSGRYPLRLMTTIPSPEEVLLMQAEGQRCISMLIEEHQIQSFVDEGRDVLGFIIHDLIHADHFFGDSDRAQAQVQFCQKLKIVLRLPEIQKMLQLDEVFKTEFHYLMSDMNSVPLHLLKTLKAVLLGYFKRKNNIAMGDSLPESEESKFHILFLDVLKPWNFTETAIDSALRLNTRHYNSHEDSELLHLALTQTCMTNA